MDGEVGSRWETGRAAYADQFRMDPDEAEGTLRKILGDTMAESAIIASGGSAWAEDDLTRRERGLVVVASMIALGGVEPRLRGYVRWALDLGATPAQLEAMVALLAVYIGYAKASVGMEVVREVIASYQEKS